MAQLYYRSSLACVSLICLAYWTFLIQSTEMQVVFDAIGYEDGGKVVAQKGGLAYFKAGLNREPLYSFIIAFCMKLGEHFHISYQIFQKILQIGLLFITQILFLIILRAMDIHKVIQILALLYLGFSPALLNASLSLFSEVATFPFVLGGVFLLYRSWQVIRGARKGSIIFFGVLTGLDFLFIAWVKGIYMLVFFIVLMHFIVAAIYFHQKNKILSRNKSLQFLCLTALVFFLGVFSIFFLNHKYNGHFQYTTRTTNSLFGSAYKRTQPLTPRIVLAHIANIPGQGVCLRFFSEEECKYCEFLSADYFSGTVLAAKLNNVPEEKREQEAGHLIVAQIKTNPIQYILFMGYESLRMFFWESTKIGFVTYPPFLHKLYNLALFKDGLRLLVSLITICSFVFIFLTLSKAKRYLFEDSSLGTRMQIGYFAFMIILAHTFFYSFAFTLTRYALPIASLYLLCIVLFLQNFIKPQERKEI